MLIELPENCVVVLIGASGSGKSTFASRHFSPSEILSSDSVREMITDEPLPRDGDSHYLTFKLLRELLDARLKNLKFTVVDATNTCARDRAPYVEIARNNDFYSIAVVLDPGLERTKAQNAQRKGRPPTPEAVVERHRARIARSLETLKSEGFARVLVLESPEEIDGTRIERIPPWSDLSEDTGPFDVIGDVHGCYRELLALLGTLGYEVDPENHRAFHPEGRKAVFLGNFAGLGPEVADVIKLVKNMVGDKNAHSVPGNHEERLRKLLNKANGSADPVLLEETRLANETQEFRDSVLGFLENLISHYILDRGRLVVAHAGLPKRFQGRVSSRVRDFCLYGEDMEDKKLSRTNFDRKWVDGYKRAPKVVYGHYASDVPLEANNTVCVDTGCVYGGSLSCYRHPEGKIVSVPAEKAYAKKS
ncbi:MAG: AAA family ATPase [Deltaproteobacteria bacterium]|jgi:protein phosphatase|nr:AAA family ATPase [Deltaproteobacteria bacterium]